MGGSNCKMGPQTPLKRGYAPGKTSKMNKNTLKLIYKKYILVHVYVGTPLCPNSFLSPRARAEGFYSISYGYTGLKFKKYLKIGISNSYSSTCICWYWPITMPIFESLRQSQGLILIPIRSDDRDTTSSVIITSY